MKRSSYAKISFTLLAIGLGGLLFSAISKHYARFAEIKQLPVITAHSVQGEVFVSTEHLDLKKRTVLLFFHPECEYCKKELDGVLSRHQECRNVQWLFLTLASSSVVEDYLMEHPLNSIPDAYVLREDWPVTYKLFDVKGPPALFIYDENGILIKRYKGATSIDSIVQDLR